MKKPTWLAIVFVAGCSASAAPMRIAQPTQTVVAPRIVSAEPLRAFGAEHLDEEVLVHGDARPQVETIRFDVDSISRATWGAPGRRSGFDLTTTEHGYHLLVHTFLFAEARVLGPTSFTAFTGGAFMSGTIPECGKHEMREARWMGFSPIRWTDEGIDVEMGRGSFDLAKCTTTTRASLFGRASAIVPGYIYALHVTESGDAITPPLDWLYVILPHGTLASASGDPSAPRDATDSGTFTRVRLALDAHAASSAAIRISPSALSFWNQLKKSTPTTTSFADNARPSQSLLVAIDVAPSVATISFGVPRSANAHDFAGILAAARKLQK